MDHRPFRDLLGKANLTPAQEREKERQVTIPPEVHQEMQECMNALLLGTITAGQYATRVKTLEVLLPPGTGWRLSDYIV